MACLMAIEAGKVLSPQKAVSQTMDHQDSLRSLGGVAEVELDVA